MQIDPFGFPIIGGWPEIDAAGMAEVDLLMVDTYGIGLPQMMENAGRSLAELARKRFLNGNAAGQAVTILAGGGGNGGGALAAARRLAGWGAQVSIVLAQEPDAMAPVPGGQLAVLRQIGLHPGPPPRTAPGLILDGLIGYSLRGEPRGKARDLIGWANDAQAEILSLDLPSGFDAQIGTLLHGAVRATATLTLALPKRGLQAQANRHAVGDLYLADISVPPALYERLSILRVVPPFAVADIVRLPI
jgi:NAD(P)H-hydrate epimerase